MTLTMLTFSLLIACALWMTASALSCEQTIHVEYNKCLGMGFHTNNCIASVERVATCIDSAVTRCGDSHVITEILSGQRVRDAYLCNNIQNFVRSANCLRQTGVLLDTCQYEYVWDTSCPSTGLASMSERMCYFYDRAMDCYEKHTGSCGAEYVATIRKFFPSNCGGSSTLVSTFRNFATEPSGDLDDDLCVYKFMRSFQRCLQTPNIHPSCSDWTEAIATCIDRSNTCGTNHPIAEVLSGQLFRDAGPAMCNNLQAISNSSSCLSRTRVLKNTCSFTQLWDIACDMDGVASMADRVCLLYQNVLACYHDYTGSCGYDYVNWLRNIFPTKCRKSAQGSRAPQGSTAPQTTLSGLTLILAASLCSVCRELLANIV